GVVSAASYEARVFGIHSAMPISQAYRRCPKGVFLPVRMARYQEVSSRIFAIFHRYTDLVEPLSLDEAFLDVTGSLRLFGTAEEIGRRIEAEIAQEEHLSASVGVATTKFVAKVASDLRKPKGFVIVEPGKEVEFLKDLPVERLWGAGPKMAKQLHRLGYRTIGDIARQGQAELAALLGQSGVHLWELANGIDPRPVIPDEPAKSIGSETTFQVDTADPNVIRQTLLELAEHVGQRLRADECLAGTLTLKFRDETFHTLTRAMAISEPTDQAPVLYRTALTLLDRIPFSGQKVRLLGLSASHLSTSAERQQLSLFGETPKRHSQLTDALDKIRTRFGDSAIKPGSLFTKRQV
ncbi:MAG: DNA polymerase IV, partial [Nitrospirota bacterium]|nr:DNA polymerase IV [Nitrospirota bacterium]